MFSAMVQRARFNHRVCTRERTRNTHFVALGGDLLSGQRAGANGMSGRYPVANKGPEFAAPTVPMVALVGEKDGTFDRATDKTP